MSTRELELKLLPLEVSSKNEDEYSIPLDISDIISICKEYSKLGMNIQNQIEQILDLGVETSIKSGFVKQESIPHIKQFLTKITQNAYFGDSCAQSLELINEIEINNYQISNKNLN